MNAKEIINLINENEIDWTNAQVTPWTVETLQFGWTCVDDKNIIVFMWDRKIVGFSDPNSNTIYYNLDNGNLKNALKQWDSLRIYKLVLI